MQPFEWSLLQSFLSVAKHGSYSAAARSAGRSQPTIGRHIEQLQTQIGATLFQRTKSGYALTTTGVALLEHAQSMEHTAARISMIADGKSESLKGTVRVTASEIVATYILPTVFASLLAVEPDLQIELVATNSTENLLLREADIAVRMVQPEQLDLISRKIGQIELGLFAARSYIDRAGLPNSFDDLHHHTLVGYDRSDLILRGMAEFGITLAREDFAYRIDDQVAYLEALRAGVGIGASQKRQAEKYDLIAVFPDIPIPPIPVWLTAHNELQSSARVRHVFDHIANHLPPLL